MKAHLQAVRAIVASLGYDVHIGDVPGSATYPYVLLWGSGGRMTSPAMCGAQDDLNDLFGVTMTASPTSTPAGTRIVATRLRRSRTSIR